MLIYCRVLESVVITIFAHLAGITSSSKSTILVARELVLRLQSAGWSSCRLTFTEASFPLRRTCHSTHSSTITATDSDTRKLHLPNNSSILASSRRRCLLRFITSVYSVPQGRMPHILKVRPTETHTRSRQGTCVLLE